MNIKRVIRALIITIFIYFSFQLFTTNPPWILLDAANLVFHEAGHLIFLIFGQFISILGGSLFQILFPIGFLIYFIIRKAPFACSVILFWIAESIINVSVYMSDAKDMNLPLLVEGTIHDWNWIFTQLGMLSYASILGNITFYFASIILIISLVAMICFTLIDTKE